MDSGRATPSGPINSRWPVSSIQSPNWMRSAPGGFWRGGRAWVRRSTAATRAISSRGLKGLAM